MTGCHAREQHDPERKCNSLAAKNKDLEPDPWVAIATKTELALDHVPIGACIQMG